MNYNIEGNAGLIKFGREAADIQRCHTIRTIGEYPIGQHSFNMLLILRVLWPDAPKELLWAIIEHDIPERLTGDIPSPSKWAGIVDKALLSEFERLLMITLYGTHHEGDLSEHLASWLRGLDILELWMFTQDQIMLGNQNFHSMALRIDRFMKSSAHLIAGPVLDLYHELCNYPWERMPELGD